jgi:hypothetical protein
MAAIKSKNRKCEMPWQGDKYIDIKKVVKSSDVDRIVTTIDTDNSTVITVDADDQTVSTNSMELPMILVPMIWTPMMAMV